MIEFLDNLTETFKSGLFLMAVISVITLAVLFLGFYLSQFIIETKRFRRCRFGKIKALTYALKYTYVYRFKDEETVLTLEKLLREKLRNPAVPEGVRIIGRAAFEKKDITSVRLPKSLKHIGTGAFTDSALERVVIPENVDYIGMNAFLRCTRLTYAEMPFVTNMHYSIFRGCKNLKTLVINGHSYDLENGGDSIDNPFFRDFSAVDLAGEGCEDALVYVRENCGKILGFFVRKELKNHMDKLFALPFDIPAEIIDENINTAINEGLHEVYLMLVRYKRERLGFEEIAGIGRRFEL